MSCQNLKPSPYGCHPKYMKYVPPNFKGLLIATDQSDSQLNDTIAQCFPKSDEAESFYTRKGSDPYFQCLLNPK